MPSGGSSTELHAAVVVSTLGMVHSIERGSNTATSLKPGDRLHTGDIIVTGSDARILIATPSGERYLVNANKRLRITASSPSGPGHGECAFTVRSLIHHAAESSSTCGAVRG